MARLSRIAIVKELGARVPRCMAAHAVRGEGNPELVIVERYPSALGQETLAIIEEDAKALTSFEHANIAPIIAIVKLKGDVAVVSEWVDGESLAGLEPPLDLKLRVFVDVLEALRALHAIDRIAGAITPDDIFLGSDGLSRIARFGLGRIAPESFANRLAYMAPELLRSSPERSARADVFSVGVLLWEALSGKRLFDATTRKERLDTPIERAVSKDAPGLVDVAEKALALDPTARYGTIAELSAAITAAGANVAKRIAVAQFMARAAGERIEARRAKLEPKIGASLSILPSTTTPPPPVSVEKNPEPTNLTHDASKPAEPTKPAVAPLVVKAEPKATKPAEVKPEPKSEPKMISAVKPAADSSPRLFGTARKPTTSTPNVTTTVRKNIPLPFPKRSPSVPDSAPNLPVAAVVAAPTPVVVPEKESPPAVHDDGVDVDVDLVSVRPPAAPPLPVPTPKTAEVKPAAPPAPAPTPPAAPQPARTPAIAVTIPIDDDEPFPVAKPRSRVGLVFGGLVLLAIGFVAGRFTAPIDAALPTPSVTTVTTESVDASAATSNASTSTPLTPPTTRDASLAVDAAAIVRPMTGSLMDRPSASALSNRTTADGGHYQPNGI